MAKEDLRAKKSSNLSASGLVAKSEYSKAGNSKSNSSCAISSALNMNASLGAGFSTKVETLKANSSCTISSALKESTSLGAELSTNAEILKTNSSCAISSALKKRKPLKADLKHKLILRDKGKCQFLLPDGGICQQSRWVENHHVIPLAQGGEDALDNITTLCATHHKSVHVSGQTHQNFRVR